MTIYVGKDKFENEELIKYGRPTDIWFHVDDLSSAHVYLRLERGQTIEDIPPATLKDCCQLTKLRSIEGKKKSEVTIIYTPWANLKKREHMKVGEIGFKDYKQVRKVKNVSRDREVLNKVGKSMEERFPNFPVEKEEWEREEEKIRKEDKRKRKQTEKEQVKAKEEQLRLESYQDMFDSDMGTSASEMRGLSVDDYEDDFM